MTRALDRLKAVSNAPKSAGNTSLMKHLNGGRLSRGQAMKAKCADCMCFHVDGRLDCRIPMCPLYPWMPYRGKADPVSTPAVEKLGRSNARGKRSTGKKVGKTA